MQQYRKTGLVLVVVLLLCLCFGFVWAKSVPIVGMVTETQGLAYWQNDSKKNRVQELAELPENAKLVLTQGSKLTVVYLASGQQYALSGPGLVQFKNTKPIALNGVLPKTIGATPVLTEKTKIDPKKVQTAAQTLVSTEAKEGPNLPVVVAAPSPPPSAPMPPRMITPSPASASGAATDAIASAEARAHMEAYEAAKQSAEAEMMAARQAETAASASMQAEREAARAAAEAAHSAARESATDIAPKPECPPPTKDDSTGQSDVAACRKSED